MKHIFRLKNALRFLKSTVLFIIILIVLSIIVVNITPRPISYIAKKLIFDTTPMKLSPDGFDATLEKVEIVSDQTYPSSYSNNTYDVYSYKHNTEPSPIIIWIHGGGFIGGDKFMVSDYATELASIGYTVIAMNYALAPHEQYPTPVNQTHELVQHLYDISSELNLDMTNIVFAGDSAGAHIASQYVITQTDAQYSETLAVESVIPLGNIKAMLLYCGPYRIEDLTGSDNKIINFLFNQLGWAYLGSKNWSTSPILKDASIVENVSEHFPPSYITDGNTASFQNSGMALELALQQLQILTKTSFHNTNTTQLIHEYQFDLQSKEGLQVLNDTKNFLSDIFQ